MVSHTIANILVSDRAGGLRRRFAVAEDGSLGFINMEDAACEPTDERMILDWEALAHRLMDAHNGLLFV